MRVSKFKLDKIYLRITQASILENSNSLFNEPTLGYLKGSEFYYIANSQWGAYNDKNEIVPEKLQEISILKTDLKNVD